MLDEPVCVFTHSEEIGFFLRRLYFPAAVRTFTVHQLGFGKEGFAGRTVHSLVISLVNVALVVHVFEHLLYLGLMVLVRGPDEFVIGRVHQVPDLTDLPCHVIYKFLRGNAGFRRFQFNLLSMLIRSGLEKHIISLKSFVAGNAVRQYDLIGIADVGFSGCISDGSGHVIFFSVHLFTSFFLILCVNTSFYQIIT